jgi:hypothetical protein
MASAIPTRRERPVTSCTGTTSDLSSGCTVAGVLPVPKGFLFSVWFWCVAGYQGIHLC